MLLDLEKDKEYYEAIPMTFIVEKQRLITISNHKNSYVIKRMATYLESHEFCFNLQISFASLVDYKQCLLSSY